MKKRIAAILFGSALALTLCACGGGDAGTTTDTNENNAENTTQAADTAKDEETPKDTASISTDSYDFSIKGYLVREALDEGDGENRNGEGHSGPPENEALHFGLLRR